MTGEDLGQVKIGSRVASDGHFGTVLYKGEVSPTQGYWLGIDWDESSRGKHNGSHEGVQYFISRYPTSGSFVRVAKVEFGISCFQAINERYGKGSSKENKNDNEVFLANVAFHNIKPTEFIGFDAVSEKQSQFDKLEDVVLHNMKVYGADPGTLAPNIVHLDLSKNLLASWESVADIIEQLPKLSFLNLSENRLQLPTESMKLTVGFPSIKSLILNRMNYSWEEILICAEMFPHLEHLTVCFNKISTIDRVISNMQLLTSLDLTSNPIENWEQIIHLGSLSSLEDLIVSNCNIQKIQFPDSLHDCVTELFTSLKSITLSNNRIDNWTSINELNKLKNLEELKITKNPLLTLDTLETTRQLIIAKIKKLKMCNKSAITSEERRGAELDYLKRFGTVWLKVGGHQDADKDHPSEEFLTEHPQYRWLIQKYGPPEDSELKVQTNSLKNSLINITISCPESTNMKQFNKKIPFTMTVQKLVTLVQRLYKIDSQGLKLSYVSTKVPGLEVVLDNAMKEVNYYSIEDGDTLYVRW